jgi:hypothetical protein
MLIAEGAPASYVASVLGQAEHAERTRERMEAAFGEMLR